MRARWSDRPFRRLRRVTGRPRRGHRAVVLGVAVGGVVASAMLWRSLGWWERQAFRAELDGRAQARAQLLTASLLRSMDVLHSVGSLVAAGTGGGTGVGDRPGGVSREQFRRFVAGPLGRQPELRALGWTPRVPAAERAAYEAAARADGLAGFEFQQIAPGGAAVRAADRAEYLPVYYLEPSAGNALALGFELDTDPTRAAALAAAAATGLPTATPPVRLVQDRPEEDLGFIVYLAIRPPGPTAGAPPAGYASAVYRIRDLAERVAGSAADDGLGFELSDAAAGGSVLFRRPAGDVAAGEPAGRAVLPLAGRAWAVTLRPSAAFVAAHRHKESRLVLAGGLVMTALLAAYLRAGQRRQAQVERLVAERTRQLEAEVDDRRRAEAAARAAEEAARSAEARYRGIFDHAVEGVFQTSPDGRYVDANPALARIYGYPTPGDLLAGLTDIADQLYVDPARRAEFVRRVRRDGEVTGFESQVYRRDGRVIWICENARAVRDAAAGEGGRVLYYEGTVVDVTERRRAADLLRSDRDALESRVRDRTAELGRAVRLLEAEVGERRRAQERAAAASAAKSRFLANVSHEIRTPMNAILGYAQLLGRAENLSADQHAAVATVLASGRHLLDLIDDVLDLSKVEAGRAEVATAAFSPAGVVAEVGALFAARCRQKGLALAVDACPNLPARATGDERKLRQVLLNLVGNAVKFTDAGGVSVRAAPAGAGADAYRFEVSDTGAGVAPEALEAIFEPFQQGAAGASRGGTGLGLAIARGHIELMGGRLRVDSVPGRGSRFHFELRLPATEGEDGADGPAAAGRGAPTLAVARPPRALVVDDAPDSRRVVADLARAIGCVAEVAASAEAALGLPDLAGFDLILVDAVMPGLDGLAAAPLLAERTGGRAKLVAMSASAMLHERGRFAAAGFAEFLPKPIELDRLARVAARVLGVGLTYKRAAGAADARPVAGEGGCVPPSLRDEIVRAARRSSVTDLRRCLAEVDRVAPGGPAADLLRRGLRAYDMELIVDGLAGEDAEGELAAAGTLPLSSGTPEEG